MPTRLARECWRDKPEAMAAFTWQPPRLADRQNDLITRAFESLVNRLERLSFPTYLVPMNAGILSKLTAFQHHQYYGHDSQARFADAVGNTPSAEAG